MSDENQCAAEGDDLRCPACGSDRNERDELIKAEREVERLYARIVELAELVPIAEANERERCAQACEQLSVSNRTTIVAAEHYDECAAAIRALSKAQPKGTGTPALYLSSEQVQGVIEGKVGASYLPFRREREGLFTVPVHLATRHDVPAAPMTAQRAVYFMERFRHEEKLLGPNEQAALDFVIAMLEAAQAPAPAPEAGPGEKWEADVECVTDESGTDYSVSIRGPGLRNPDYSDVWLKKRPAEQLVKWLNKSVLPRFNVQGAAVAPAPEPDMFWDASDGERFGHDIPEIIADYGPGDIVKIDCAKRMPRVIVRVVGDSGDYEVIPAEVKPPVQHK